jgi:hypothetical protein
MLRFVLAIVPLILTGCAASRQEVAARLGEQFIGQSVDMMAAQFGPPASSFRLTTGGSSYLWQLASVSDVNVDRGFGTVSTRSCKVKVMTDPAGIVRQLDTEDASASTGVYGAMGIGGSICAQRLRMKAQT